MPDDLIPAACCACCACRVSLAPCGPDRPDRPGRSDRPGRAGRPGRSDRAALAFARGALALALALALSPAAVAGPVDPSRHAFEHVGPVGPASAGGVVLPVPETNRLLVLAADGEVRLVTGGGLASRSLGSLPVDAGCAGPAVFDATWHPDPPGAPGRDLLVSLRAEDTGSLAVVRVSLAPDRRSFTVANVFDTGLPSSCERVGGALGLAADGTLLIGVGDHGNPGSATSVTSLAGAILRVTTDGLAPAPPLEPNPLGATSPVYATGVREPVGIATDALTGETWFLDRGPSGGFDELNLLAPLTNHGWSDAELSGHLDVAGDPHHAWTPPIGVTGLVADGDSVLGTPASSRFLVAADTAGLLTRVTPDPGDPRGSTEELLFEPDPTGPRALFGPRVLDDGSLLVVADDERAWRLRARRASAREPSRRSSALPAMLRKDAPGSYVLAVERVGDGVSLGVHRGSLDALAGGAYPHADAPDLALSPAPEDGEALARWSLDDDDLGGAGGSVYILVGAFDACGATGLGVDSTWLARPGGGEGGGGVAVLGGGTNDLSGVEVSEIAVGADGLSVPRDLEFHPDVPGQLWIVNRQDDSTLIVDDAGRATQSSDYVWSDSGNHFLAQPSALAFGPGTRFFATSHEEDDYTQGPPPGGTPVDFMGPTLWTNDAAEYDGGHASHYDMLHNSPNGAGIAWESGTAYWIFDGWHQSLTRYDFQSDHGAGGSDHSDGIIDRHAEGLVSYVPDVPSHLAWDHDEDVLLVADTGNNRIAVYDPTGASASGAIGPNYDGCTMNGMSGGTLTTLIEGADHGLVAPSGLEVDGCRLFVSDNATSTIHAFTRDGRPLDRLETGWPPGTLMGMAIDPRDGDLYVVDALGDRVLRISPRR